jgi:L-arabinose isomerase
MTGFPETTFTEMFCPDWKGNKIFLSHMGEINTDLCAEKAILQEKPFPYTDADNPVVT